MDGYDKLKRFGIAVHGCIGLDGFSRHIIWLHASNYQQRPTSYRAVLYVDAIAENGGCPMILRADMGTENTIVEQLQIFLREEQKSFLYGRSVNNQRIESWWGMLRRQNIQFWINLFEQLLDEMMFDGSFLDKSLIQFCFLHIVQVGIFHEYIYGIGQL